MYIEQCGNSERAHTYAAASCFQWTVFMCNLCVVSETLRVSSQNEQQRDRIPITHFTKKTLLFVRFGTKLLSSFHCFCCCCTVLYCKQGRGQVDGKRPTPPVLFTFVSHFFSFVFVLHVQFCKAKSRCTLSQVVHQQHSVTVSYHSLLQYLPPCHLSFPYFLHSSPLLPSPSPSLLSLFSGPP